MFVHRSSGSRGQLRLFLRLLLNFSNLLSLRGRSTDFHTKNNVSDFGLCQRSDVDAAKEINFIIKAYPTK